MAGGRPTDYNQELVTKICGRLSSGESARSICLDKDMPVTTTMFRWMNEKPEFREQYLKAKELGCEAMFADIISISDDGFNDFMEKSGDEAYKVNGEAIARSKLRVDSRKWYLSKIAPKLYGDFNRVEHSQDPENPINSLSDNDLQQKIIDLQAKLNEQE